MSSSEDGTTLSCVKLDSASELEKLYKGENVIVQGKLKSTSRSTSKSSSSKSSSRKRRLDNDDRSNPSFRKRKKFLQENTGFQQEPMLSTQLQLIEAGDRSIDENKSIMQLATIDDPSLPLPHNEVLRLTGGSEQEVADLLKDTQLQYQRELCYWMNKMRKADIGCDMQFLTPDDTLVYAHSMIVRSVPYFAKILNKQIGKNCDKNAPLHITVSASEDILKTILDFLYTGTCKIDRKNVLLLLDQASRIQFTKLSETCAELIKKWGIITPNNCLTILKLVESHPRCVACRALKDYVLGTLWEGNYLECVLNTSQLDMVLDLSSQSFQTLLFRSVHNVDEQAANCDMLFECVKTYLANFTGNHLGTKATQQQAFRLLNTLSHRHVNCSSDRGSKFEIVVPERELNGYTCSVSCQGATFDLQFNVVEDIDGDKWLGLSCDFKSELLKPTWYRSIAFKYTLLSESCVFACCEERSIFVEKDFRKGTAGARRVIGMLELRNACNSYVNMDGEIRFDVHIEPDHVFAFAVHHVIQNFQEIWQDHNDAILSLGINLLTFILQQDELNVDNEGIVLRIICLWLTDEYLDVELFDDSDIIELLSCVRWTFASYKDIDSAFELVHNARSGAETMKYFQQCAQKLSCSNDKPRDSYKDRSTNFQAWKSIFQNDWNPSSNKIRLMLEIMSSLLGKLANKGNVPTRSEIEARISQEVRLGSSNLTQCTNFLESLLNKQCASQL